jgi:hypothetical protein
MEAFAAPIKPGKLEDWEGWVGELTGARKSEFEDMNQRHGLTTHAAWLQANPDGSHIVVVVLDGSGAPTFLGNMAQSDHAFDKWFASGIENVHPMDFSAPPPPAPERRL